MVGSPLPMANVFGLPYIALTAVKRFVRLLGTRKDVLTRKARDAQRASMSADHSLDEASSMEEQAELDDAEIAAEKQHAIDILKRVNGLRADVRS